MASVLVGFCPDCTDCHSTLKKKSQSYLTLSLVGNSGLPHTRTGRGVFMATVIVDFCPDCADCQVTLKKKSQSCLMLSLVGVSGPPQRRAERKECLRPQSQSCLTLFLFGTAGHFFHFDYFLCVSRTVLKHRSFLPVVPWRIVPLSQYRLGQLCITSSGYLACNSLPFPGALRELETDQIRVPSIAFEKKMFRFRVLNKVW